ncbi:hypothetical protein [Chryseobacterium taihuense]|uniref:CD-NTase-associated protein 12/Pycsar effector protein TIR domain-containing protein n=1 Tax=Chryseobacterium taihuense TaxID=1141221 RepID=A0ABY0QSX8_9FLAO|nr:hypothetical protein [Chryseobacterium taihuense]SDL79208.1 hypothetical protein SAMN05216273_106114 [Chryseobacterium taihuense]
MNHTIFYSWQSDLKNSCNRSFILNALEKAAKDISKDENFNIDAVIDRDTFGISGSPSIVDSIAGKIAKSDVFICDISIINFNSEGRKTPNPNVLYELGFASAILGWDRIIMIQNTAFGNIEDLPFDLRGRRILQYHLDSSSTDKNEERDKLKNDLTNILKSALKHFGSETITKEKNIWWGNWLNESKVKNKGGNLIISRVSSDSFFFNISIYDGARTGEINGKAQILTPNSAFAKISSFDEKDCHIIFRRRIENDIWLIEIEEGENCNSYHGHNSSFSGIYMHKTELVIDEGFLDEIDMNEINRLSGKYVNTFLENFQQFGEAENLDGEEYIVVSSGVKGLYTIMESIVVKDQIGNIWFAFIDPEFDIIRYYSNNEKRSKSIDNWLTRFKDKEVKENNENNIENINDI